MLRELARHVPVLGLHRGAGSASDQRFAGDWSRVALQSALVGATGVVHAASVVHKPSTPPDEYVRFNVDGTRALVEAARAVGVRRFVFVSSIKVHGEDPRGVIDEHTPTAAEAHYARTKAEAEKIVLAATDLNPVVLRLCPVFGRGDKGNVRTVIRAIHRRRFVIPGPGTTRKSIVHVSTVANVARAAALENPVGGVFVVADRVAPSIRELADTVAASLGRRRPLSVPLPLVRAAANVVGRVARRLGRATSISSDIVDKSVKDSVCDPSRITRELGLDPHVDLRWAIDDEVEWLRNAGLL